MGKNKFRDEQVIVLMGRNEVHIMGSREREWFIWGLDIRAFIAPSAVKCSRGNCWDWYNRVRHLGSCGGNRGKTSLMETPLKGDFGR